MRNKNKIGVSSTLMLVTVSVGLNAFDSRPEKSCESVIVFV